MKGKWKKTILRKNIETKTKKVQNILLNNVKYSLFDDRGVALYGSLKGPSTAPNYLDHFPSYDTKSIWGLLVTTGAHRGGYTRYRF